MHTQCLMMLQVNHMSTMEHIAMQTNSLNCISSSLAMSIINVKIKLQIQSSFKSFASYLYGMSTFITDSEALTV